MRKIACALVVLCVPFSAIAAEGSIARRDGFLLIWKSLRRPSFSVRETPFSDVAKGSNGFEEITYAKSRGILDDEETFRPDDSLQLHEALVWLFRTRNIDDPDAIAPATLAAFLERYPIADVSAEYLQTEPLTQEKLLELMRALDARLAEEDHEVSLYAEKFHGKGTAFGETFDMHALTAAHRTYPHNTLVRVTNIENGKSVVVRINDRGPFVEGRDMDLSLASFTAIADRAKGKIRARFERLGDASLADACADSRQLQTRITRDVRLIPGLPRTFTLGGTLLLRGNAHFVVRSVRYPDGTFKRLQDWILQGEEFSMKPSVPGHYVFHLGTPNGRIRSMGMTVRECQR